MGILAEPEAFIRSLVPRLPHGFTVCELGDQYITHGQRRLARELYHELGASRYVSIDGNGRGTHTFDLNKPLPADLGRFDLVTDFGTGEHIFNQLQVFKSLHWLTKVGGFIVFDGPTQGYRDHCYFNRHPCLFRDIAAANKWEVVRFEQATTPRGELLRGIFRRGVDIKFRIPQQGRYRKILQPIIKPHA